MLFSRATINKPLKLNKNNETLKADSSDAPKSITDPANTESNG